MRNLTVFYDSDMYRTILEQALAPGFDAHSPGISIMYKMLSSDRQVHWELGSSEDDSGHNHLTVNRLDGPLGGCLFAYQLQQKSTKELLNAHSLTTQWKGLDKLEALAILFAFRRGILIRCLHMSQAAQAPRGLDAWFDLASLDLFRCACRSLSWLRLQKADKDKQVGQ